MNKYYYHIYLSCFFFILCHGVSAQAPLLQLPSAVSCNLNVPLSQRDVFLKRCIELAQANNQEAQYQLGLYFSQGILTPPNYAEAIYWFKQASLQAHVHAQLQLGYMYFKGEGVSVDNLQAYIIFKIASINGSDEAMDAADLAANHMTPKELQQATAILGKAFRQYMIIQPK